GMSRDDHSAAVLDRANGQAPTHQNDSARHRAPHSAEVGDLPVERQPSRCLPATDRMPKIYLLAADGAIAESGLDSAGGVPAAEVESTAAATAARLLIFTRIDQSTSGPRPSIRSSSSEPGKTTPATGVELITSNARYEGGESTKSAALTFVTFITRR
ncbi:hypothetical protein ACWKWA_15475, partial [Dermacoccus abyssi]